MATASLPPLQHPLRHLQRGQLRLKDLALEALALEDLTPEDLTPEDLTPEDLQPATRVAVALVPHSMRPRLQPATRVAVALARHLTLEDLVVGSMRRSMLLRLTQAAR